jgi:osmotically-inducible protein OsmY
MSQPIKTAPTAQKTDFDILQDVTREMAWDARLVPTEIGIQVQDGIVTLSGTIDSWPKRRAAQDAAHRVAGVLDVANDLEVKLPGDTRRTDTEIARAVRQALEWDVMVPHEQIRTTVAHGVVTLEGTVSHWRDRADAERAIERLMGVTHVNNQIDVEPCEELDIDQAREAVEKALERRAEREAGRIELRSSDAGLQVVGTVHSLEEREAVLGAVRGARGVRRIIDCLQVEPRR